VSDYVKENLLRLMAARAMGPSELSRRSGLDVRTIRAVVQGRSRPRARTLHRLAEGLGVKVDELFLDPGQLLYRRFDRQTNPVVEELMEIASAGCTSAWKSCWKAASRRPSVE